MGVFQIFLDKKSGHYCWRMLSLNGAVIATCEGYKSKEDCLYGIEAVRRLAEKSTLDDQTYNIR